jgi:hypothetical protein
MASTVYDFPEHRRCYARDYIIDLIYPLMPLSILPAGRVRGQLSSFSASKSITPRSL